ncbi:ABC transporter substrate-binding protein [Limnobacter litoralis]|uniref:Branched-chain amino acid ABC transporter substrate-binding protein n=1 Tax=Limnobacter litoralis TaxID=481366 RepID=A0ABQ5YQN6_9BURK|nr:ABC transporter substrate-binding protein [Limnobacter litoralis]GLR26904.1 branched-chain amino acid ABC transporter substrate-binding protein [Limnobacter litoralis]
MKLKKIFKAVGAACAFGAMATAHAGDISGDVIKIGMITDLSGVYADIDGPGGVQAVKMAIADMGGKINGKKVEFIYADHQNKADIAASKAREWFDQEGVDMLIAGTNSGTALAIAKVASEKHKPLFVIGAGSSALTNDQCSPYTIHYAYDTVALAKGTGGAVTKQGGKKWFFLTADYAFGISLYNDTAAVVKKNGGTVVGEVRHPLSTSDFSSFMLQAQASGAQIVGLANAGGDTVNSIKAANEFGVTKTMKLAGLLMFISDVHSLGLNQTKGMYLTDSWYWDQDDAARKWAKRFYATEKKMPTSLHAADYSATLNYLKAVQKIGTDNPDKVMTELKSMKYNDMYVKDGYYRADGSLIHNMYLMQVKQPSESKGEWDLLNVVQTIPGEEAFTSKADSKCAAWK